MSMLKGWQLRWFGPKVAHLPESEKFCRDCGRLLHINSWVQGYDENTGKPKMAYQYVCENMEHTHKSYCWWTAERLV